MSLQWNCFISGSSVGGENGAEKGMTCEEVLILVNICVMETSDINAWVVGCPTSVLDGTDCIEGY